MLEINQMKLPIEHTEADMKNKIIKELKLRHIFKNVPSFEYKIIRKSVDARKKPDIFYTYTVIVCFEDCKQNAEDIVLKKCSNKNISKYEKNIYKPRMNVETNCKSSPLIVGEGPAGLFAGLVLSYAGLKPIIIERGDSVDIRSKKIKNFWENGELDEETNVQFGEGGAGTFSDGKLNTLVKDKTGKNQFVLDTFVRFGANEEVSYDAKPHVGTDVLEIVVKNIRNEIEHYGGKVINNCKLTDIIQNDSKLVSVITNDINEIKCDDLILATGHSARDTFRMLYDKGVHIEQKNFAIGIRIQHPQKMIDDAQYGKNHSDLLKPSPYKLTNHTSNNRDVFSFCMCPGGYVVNASSIRGHVCVNGMSYSQRDSENANSALIVAIDRADFGSNHPLAGVQLQEKIEKKAYELGEGKIPVQLFKDFKNNTKTKELGNVSPVFKGDICFSNIREIFTEEICEALIESINKFGYTIEGFDSDDAIIAAVESRTSSPIRITRDNDMQSNISGIYPCGEGAGYAGGIMSAAMDGIRVAEAIIEKYKL